MSSRLPEILIARRNALGLTQEQVAKAIEKGLRTYIYYEDGETTPKHDTLLKLAKEMQQKCIQRARLANRLKDIKRQVAQTLFTSRLS